MAAQDERSGAGLGLKKMPLSRFILWPCEMEALASSQDSASAIVFKAL